MSYRFMRLLLMFDLPTKTANQRKVYRQFRKFLIGEGFIMHQFSVYSKIFLNNTNKEFLISKINQNAPKEGVVTLLSVTEKQFSKMIYLTGDKDTSIRNSDKRIIILGDEND